MWIYLAIGLLGIVGGMLVNYLADVLPIKRRLVAPLCTHCGATQSWHGYLLWPRRCAACGTERSARVWFVEVAFVVATLALYALPEMRSVVDNFWMGYAILLFFGVVAVIDIEYKLILHPVSWFGVGLGLIVGLTLHGWQETLLGGVVGYGVMYVLYGLGALFIRLLGKMRGEAIDDVALGFGDVNLMGVLGLMLGPGNVFLNLLLSIAVAALISLLVIGWNLVRRQYRVGMAIPYGPFLILGAVLLLFFPETAQEMLKIIFPVFALVD